MYAIRAQFKRGYAMKFIVLIALFISTAVAAGDIIINEDGQTEGNEFQKAVFVSIFLPEDMVCSQPVKFVRPVEEYDNDCDSGDGLVISPCVKK